MITSAVIAPRVDTVFGRALIQVHFMREIPTVCPTPVVHEERFERRVILPVGTWVLEHFSRKSLSKRGDRCLRWRLNSFSEMAFSYRLNNRREKRGTKNVEHGTVATHPNSQGASLFEETLQRVVLLGTLFPTYKYVPAFVKTESPLPLLMLSLRLPQTSHFCQCRHNSAVSVTCL